MENQEKKNAQSVTKSEKTKVEETTTRQASKSQTVRSFGNNVKNLIELKLVSEEDGKILQELNKKIIIQFMGFDIFS